MTRPFLPAAKPTQVADKGIALASTAFDPGAAMTERFARVLRIEGERGRRLQLYGRTGALAVCCLLVGVLAPWPPALFYLGAMLILAALGLAQIALESRAAHREWSLGQLLPYGFAVLDVVIVAIVLLTPNPLSPRDLPMQMLAGIGNEVFFFPILISLAFSFSPLLVLWGSFVMALVWGAGVGFIAALPGSLPMLLDARDVSQHLHPGFVDLGVLIQQCVVFLVAGALLAMVVERTRLLVTRQARLERERANLARYFSPTVVDRLSHKDAALSRLGERQVAVLFADLVGFTAWSEHQTPDDVLSLLREAHARVESAVFAHQGAVDKFIGDGVMATFGAPDPGPRDAINALDCAAAIIRSMADLTRQRQDAGLETPPMSIGLHYGKVVIGDIGTERRMELAVLGDTVNVASRLESLTRELGCHAALSDELYAAARREAAADADDPRFAQLEPAGAQTLRGRGEKIAVWKLN